MEKISINTSSWHYKLNNKFHWMGGIYDSCQYNRATMLSLLFLALFLFVAIVVLFAIGTMVGYIMAFLSSGVFVTEFMVLPILVFSIALSFFLAHWFTREKTHKETEPSKPSAVKELYAAFKEKYCKQIEFK